MVKRKPGTLMPLEITILAALDGAPSDASALARDLSRLRNSVQQALVRLERMGHTRSRFRSPSGASGGARRIFTLTAKGRKALQAAAKG